VNAAEAGDWTGSCHGFRAEFAGLRLFPDV
jgi:hypothetical protein